MSKKYIIITATIAVLFIAASLCYLNVNFGRVDGDPWEMIPNDAALIIEIDKPGELFAKLEDGNSIWKSILEVHDVEYLNTKISLLDSLFREKTEYTRC